MKNITDSIVNIGNGSINNAKIIKRKTVNIIKKHVFLSGFISGIIASVIGAIVYNLIF